MYLTTMALLYPAKQSLPDKLCSGIVIEVWRNGARTFLQTKDTVGL